MLSIDSSEIDNDYKIAVLFLNQNDGNNQLELGDIDLSYVSNQRNRIGKKIFFSYFLLSFSLINLLFLIIFFILIKFVKSVNLKKILIKINIISCIALVLIMILYFFFDYKSFKENYIDIINLLSWNYHYNHGTNFADELNSKIPSIKAEMYFHKIINNTKLFKKIKEGIQKENIKAIHAPETLSVDEKKIDSCSQNKFSNLILIISSIIFCLTIIFLIINILFFKKISKTLSLVFFIISCTLFLIVLFLSFWKFAYNTDGYIENYNYKEYKDSLKGERKNHFYNYLIVFDQISNLHYILDHVIKNKKSDNLKIQEIQTRYNVIDDKTKESLKIIYDRYQNIKRVE